MLGQGGGPPARRSLFRNAQDEVAVFTGHHHSLPLGHNSMSAKLKHLVHFIKTTYTAHCVNT